MDIFLSPPVAFLLIIFLGAVIFYLVYVFFIHEGPVYLPSSFSVAEKMMELAGVKKGMTVLDLGSGDGRILFAAAKRGARAIGYEIDPFLVLETRKKVKKMGLQKLVRVHCQSFWKADFNQADVIAVYLLPKYMEKLEKLLKKRLKKKILVVSNFYRFPHQSPLLQKGRVILYEFP
ncbi:methyltransferase domain-containing protein [bacterium]|nr:methyltransferase domain-containing protein [bacterium]